MNDASSDRFGMWVFAIAAITAGATTLVTGQAGWKYAYQNGLHIRIGGGLALGIGCYALFLLLRRKRQ